MTSDESRLRPRQVYELQIIHLQKYKALMQSNSGEIIFYQPESSSDFRLEVHIEDKTVWLTQA